MILHLPKIFIFIEWFYVKYRQIRNGLSY